MDRIPFVKYHGAGNDFILIDDRQDQWNHRLNEQWIAMTCHRRFGVGADGLILLQEGNAEVNFKMKYYNSDGRPGTFCGNGARCIVAFAYALKVHTGSCHFLAADGLHEGKVLPDGLIQISMSDVTALNQEDENSIVLDTGSPHYIRFQNQLDNLNVYAEGKAIRNSPKFVKDGINVNFVDVAGSGEITIRTYERGVEDETFACGTGVVASAIASAVHRKETITDWLIHAKGGDLRVTFQKNSDQNFTNIKLTGPAVEVYKGEIPIATIATI